MPLSEEQRRELWRYVREYKYERKIRGTWWDLATAIEAALAEIASHREPFPFSYGSRVGLKKPKKGRERWGVITSYPRRGSRLAYVKWPDGWAGHVRIDDLTFAPLNTKDKPCRRPNSPATKSPSRVRSNTAPRSRSKPKTLAPPKRSRSAKPMRRAAAIGRRTT